MTIRLIEDKTSRHDEHDDGPAAGEGADTCLLDTDADASSPSSDGFRLLRESFAAVQYFFKGERRARSEVCWQFANYGGLYRNL